MRGMLVRATRSSSGVAVLVAACTVVGGCWKRTPLLSKVQGDIQTALSLYRQVNGWLPSSLGDLVPHHLEQAGLTHPKLASVPGAMPATTFWYRPCAPKAPPDTVILLPNFREETLRVLDDVSVLQCDLAFRIVTTAEYKQLLREFQEAADEPKGAAGGSE